MEVDSSKDSDIKQLLTSKILSKYFQRVQFMRKDLIFDVNEPSNEVDVSIRMNRSVTLFDDQVYFIETGDVEIVSISQVTTKGSEHPEPLVRRVNKVSAGGCFGIYKRN